MKQFLLIIFCFCGAIANPAFSQGSNEASEPSAVGPATIDLLRDGTLDAWKVPSDHWNFDGNSIVGQTGPEPLEIPEWLYTKQEFSDFVFSCDLRLTGDKHRNTGIYFRVQTFHFDDHPDLKPFDAPSGYECDASYHNPAVNNYWGSLGDWYARRSLRIYADQAVLEQACSPGEWNRMTIRARSNRLEYWINGIKVMDYVDHDPKASREGVIGFQIHNGSVMKVEYKNIHILPLTL